MFPILWGLLQSIVFTVFSNAGGVGLSTVITISSITTTTNTTTTTTTATPTATTTTTAATTTITTTTTTTTATTTAWAQLRCITHPLKFIDGMCLAG